MPFRLTIAKVTTSGGEVLVPPRDGVVAIVGPNNTGKSAFLRELLQILSVHPSNVQPERVVIDGVEVEKEGQAGDLVAWLEEHAYGRDRVDDRYYKRSGVDWSARSSLATWWNTGPGFATLAAFLVFLGQAEGRLGQVGGSGQYDVINDQPGNPTQVLYARRELEERLCAISQEAFGVGITLNRFGGNMPLLWGTIEPEPPVYPSEEYLDLLRALPALHAQGDGVKSFMGTMLLLVTAAYPILLLDEPEAFLHPPQAKLMGRKLREEVPADTQVLIATHSLDIVEGLLAGGGHAVTIARLTRTDDTNHLAVLDHGVVDHLWRDPLLRFSNVLEGLFHRGVVVCEADADCRFYAAVLEEARSEETAGAHDLLFTHCGGKHRIPTVVRALRAVGVPVVVVADFDVLRQSRPFGDIVEALGHDPADYEPMRQRVAAALTARQRNPSVSFVRETIERVLAEAPGPTLSRKEAEEVTAAIHIEDGWKEAKEQGLDAVPRGQQYAEAEALLRDLQTVGLFIVPVGEMEGWVREIGSKGPRWVIDVLEKGLHADRNLAARAFIQSAASVIT